MESEHSSDDPVDATVDFTLDQVIKLLAFAASKKIGVDGNLTAELTLSDERHEIGLPQVFRVRLIRSQENGR